MKSLVETQAPNKGSIITTPKWPSSRRTPSTSSLSSNSNSSSSFRSDSPPASPSTPLHRFATGGIPFSWETIPGIPKKQMLKKIDSSRNHHNHLPLPPAAAPVSGGATTKSTHKKRITPRRDPFYAALVECSKGGDNGSDNNKAVFGSMSCNEAKQGRSLMNYMSCKSSSVVSESLVLLPRGTRRIAYDMVVKKRTGG